MHVWHSVKTNLKHIVVTKCHRQVAGLACPTLRLCSDLRAVRYNLYGAPPAACAEGQRKYPEVRKYSKVPRSPKNRKYTHGHVLDYPAVPRTRSFEELMRIAS